jgi:hypothetical protein
MIELEGWGLALPLHPFEFFQNLPNCVPLYVTEDSQLHRKSPNLEGVNRISHRPAQLRCIPHLEAIAISKQIQLKGWRLAQPLYLFEFFQNLSYLVLLYATKDLQLHRKSPNREGVSRISPRLGQRRCILPSGGSHHF